LYVAQCDIKTSSVSGRAFAFGGVYAATEWQCLQRRHGNDSENAGIGTVRGMVSPGPGARCQVLPERAGFCQNVPGPGEKSPVNTGPVVFSVCA